MAAKPEAAFVRSINRKLPKDVDYQSMAGTYTNGIADMYYDGPVSDLWVEYKFVARLPKTLDLILTKTKPVLTALQNRFLCRRADNGHRVAVIVGCTGGGVIFSHPRDWFIPWPREELNVIDRAKIAEWIWEVTTRGIKDEDAYVSRRKSNNGRAQ